MIGSDRPPEALAAYTGFLLNWFARRSEGRFARAMAEVGLHPREFVVLVVLAAGPGTTQQSVGEQAGVDPSTMVATLDALEARGLVERRPDVSDRRRRAVHLTAKGESVLAAAREVAGGVAREVFGVLGEDERAELHRLLLKLAGAG